MKSWDIIANDGEATVKATASTKAGLVGVAVQGVCSALEPEKIGAALAERPFVATGEHFRAVLQALCEQALDAAQLHKEAYDDVRLSLITDTKAEGAFLGKATEGFGRNHKVRSVSDVAKNEDGAWVADIVLS